MYADLFLVGTDGQGPPDRRSGADSHFFVVCCETSQNLTSEVSGKIAHEPIDSKSDDSKNCQTCGYD